MKTKKQNIEEQHCNCPDCICGDEDCPGQEALLEELEVSEN